MSRNTFIIVLKFLFSVDYVIWGCFVSFSCLLKCPLFKVNGHFLVLCHWIISTMGQVKRNSCNPCLVTWLIFWILSFFFNLVLGVVSLTSSKKFSSFCSDFIASFNAMGILLQTQMRETGLGCIHISPSFFSLQSPIFRLLFRSYSQMSARDMN